MKVWVLSTCVPNESEPCMPQVFTSEEKAEAAFEQTMRDEWASYEDWNGFQNPVWPGDPRKAQDIMSKASESWGRWEITAHNIDPPAPTGWRWRLKGTSSWHYDVTIKNGNDPRVIDPKICDVDPFWVGQPAPTKPTFIPENEHGVKPGYYTKPDIVRLLRRHNTDSQAVHFIADMME